MKEKSSPDVAQLMKANEIVLVDVREPSEFQAEHIPGAINIPLSTLEPEMIQSLSNGKECIVQCRSGKRAAQAYATLIEKIPGFHAAVVKGGIQEWKQCGLPTKKAGSGISIFRQIQIVSGTLVLLGTVLGLSVNSGFFVVPAFVGTGLAFAGVSGWCGLALVLERMPWNVKISCATEGQ